MIQPEIIRSKRKTITLTVDNTCRVTVKAPLRMSLAEINKFLSEKEGWLQQKIDFYSNITKSNQGVLDLEELLYLGQRYRVEFSSVKCVCTEGNIIYFPLRLKEDREAFSRAVIKWGKETAKEYLTSRVLTCSQALQFPYTSLKITNSRKRWGSCDDRGGLSFNFRIIMLPPYIIDYIIIHELVHIKHLNHSALFWAEVEKHLPNFKQCRKTLKEHNFIMNILR